MRILFVSQYFVPEMGAPAVRTFDHCRRWVEAGHDVQVLTAFPNHPNGEIYPGYTNKLWQRETIDGVDVLRVLTYLTPGAGIVRRSIQYVLFFLAAIIGSFGTRRADVVIGTSPQFLVAVAAWAIAFIRRVPFVFEIRDLWPDSILAVGAIENPLIIGVLRTIERFLFNRATHIVVVTESFRERLQEIGVPPEKISVVFNSADVDIFYPRKPCPWLRKRYDVENSFVVSYIGTHGMAHCLEHLLETAWKLRDDERYHFFFVGEGAEKRRLKQLRSHMRLRNVTFIDREPRERMPCWLATTDLHVVHLKDNPLFRTVIPSKIFESLAMAKPMVLCVDGEARRLVEGLGAGVFSPPGDSDTLVDTIRRLAAAPEELAAMGHRGRQAALDYYNRDNLAGQYLDVLRHIVPARTTAAELTSRLHPKHQRASSTVPISGRRGEHSAR